MEYQEIYEKTKEIVVGYLGVEPMEVEPHTNLVDEFCLDSIALVELGFRFSENFSIPMVEGNPELFVMKNLVDFIANEIDKNK